MSKEVIVPLKEEEVIIPLPLDNGDTVDCIVLSIFEVDGENYIALFLEEAEEILLYRYRESEDDQAILENIDNDLEFDRVLEVFDGLVEGINEDE